MVLAQVNENKPDNSVINPRKILAILACAFIARLAFSFGFEGTDFRFFLSIGDDWINAGQTPYTFARPYQYTPLYLYFLAIAKLLSAGDHILYRVFAKLPQMAGDVLVGWMIIKIIFRKTGNERSALAAGLFYLFNPLLIFNCAYYGRFDQLSSFFAVAGFALYEMRLCSPLLFAASFCVKTYTLFFFPFFLFRDRRRMVTTGVAFILLLGLLTIPFLLKYQNNAETIQVMFNLAKHWPLGLSWQTILYRFMDVQQIMVVSKFVLMLYLVVLMLVPKRDFLSYAAFSLAMFPLFSMISFEQYMTWSIPFLIMDYCINHKKHAIAMALVFTTVGMISNESISIMKAADLPQSILNISYAACMIAYAAAEVIWLKRNGGDLSIFQKSKPSATGGI